MTPPFDPRRWLPVVQIAANVAGATVLMQLVTAGLFPWSHHWVLPIVEGALLAQVLATGGRGWALAACSLLLLAITVARRETIWLSHHLIHFALTFALAAPLHARVAVTALPGSWRTSNRWWAAGFGLVAILAAALAVRQGIWWGIRDGT